ncbi:hypothetical protein TrVE_jg6953 [Triparma verrucosa]|uniref:PAS domain-containing protein n=1 Tax=Triparma verrucosa TaxID=1606542 RepID=A0A9W7BLN1_9STRA|nr:hypothetical protein TrVE_jg6953 [Triparma verrucosa]
MSSIVARSTLRSIRSISRLNGVRSLSANKGSFSSPESDFSSQNVAGGRTPPEMVMSSMSSKDTNLSFSSPESDFTATNDASESSTYSPNLSFSSPESDFTAAFATNDASLDPSESSAYATNLSFNSPESDFVAGGLDHTDISSESSTYTTNLSFSSPESDFVAGGLDHADLSTRAMDMLTGTEEGRSNLAYSLSFSSPEADFSSLGLTDEQRMMLDSVEQVMAANTSSISDVTIEEAFAASDDARVITELTPPFKIKSVNSAWVSLCGFTAEESMGKHLGILQGDRTDANELERLTAQILAGVPTEAKLVNYTKEGREFRNNLKISFVVDELTKERVAVMGTLREVAA